jgi:RHH-type transcriptional regulator, proline utilization regulon repressor / proline dehydrogenase / delta 1-pyrroline-5-carboxylate dehydrogenase
MIGAALVEHSLVAGVAFTGSTALLEQVTDDVIKYSFHSAGQRYSALRVLYVQNDIADAAIEMIRGAMMLLKTGDPRDLDTDVGPVIDGAAASSLRMRVEELKARGCANYFVHVRTS